MDDDIDRLSELPDALICHILSFLLTKEVVATSVLSKRWTPLGCSVPSLDADYYTGSNNGGYNGFVQSVNAAIHSRDLHQPIQKFRLRFIPHAAISEWVNLAVQRKVQHFDLSIIYPWFPTQHTNLSAIFTCSTLVVLQLQGLKRLSLTSVDLPILKVLHLQHLSFSERGCLAKLLSGCPVLEDFKAASIAFDNQFTDREFKTLPKLVRADISLLSSPFLLMKLVNNVEFLRIQEMEFMYPQHDIEGTSLNVFPEFHNLTHIELTYRYCINDWLQLVELLKHCSKLQVLVINQPYKRRSEMDEFVEEETGDQKHPSSVPECILLCLKKCYLNEYGCSRGEFQFARYILRNGRSLERMTICCDIDANEQKKLKTIDKLSSCTMSSATCKLFFK